MTYQQLYPGIDLAYTGTNGQLKSTFHLAAGADAALIRWRYTGVTNVATDTAGNLVVTVPLRGPKATQPITITERAPTAWQEINGAHVTIDVRFRVENDNSIRFELGPYDSAYPLTIDPTLTYSSYLGGSGDDEGHVIAVDTNGNIYIAGQTYSNDFPPSNAADPSYNGLADVFVTKLSADGRSLVYSTFFGGDATDNVHGLAVDSLGNAHIVGGTNSTIFPQQYGLANTWGTDAENAFVARFTSTGTLVYSTLLGGSFYDVGTGIAVDSANNAYITGSTDSLDFPPVHAYQETRANTSSLHSSDTFITKLTWSGSSLGYSYSTYLGGTDSESGGAIAIDNSGNAYIEGSTSSNDFPRVNAFDETLGGGVDTFVAKLNSSGNILIYSTYLGGSDNDPGSVRRFSR